MSDADGASGGLGVSGGLSLAPFRGLRPTVDGDALGRRLCPPYDVIDEARRQQLLAEDPDNAVAVVLPEPTPEGYEGAAARLRAWVDDGVLRLDDQDALYVYEMREPDGNVTRGLLGALELRDPADGVVLPHENTMAGPVADRLAVMTATAADLEPIYLVYDGGGPASQLVADVGAAEPLAATVTPDGVTHRLWAVTDPAAHRAVADDLATRHALIADGHHRYATYRERQQRRRAESGPAGPSPVPGIAGWPCWWTPPSTARRCIPSTARCLGCRCRTLSVGWRTSPGSSRWTTPRAHWPR